MRVLSFDHKLYPNHFINGPYINNKDTFYVMIRDKATNKTITKVYARYLMEVHLGRYLLSTEVVHHKDRNKANNDISNLILHSNTTEHMVSEHSYNPAGKEFVCPECKKLFKLTADQVAHFKSRQKRKKVSGPYCSHQCTGSATLRLSVTKERGAV